MKTYYRIAKKDIYDKDKKLRYKKGDKVMTGGIDYVGLHGTTVILEDELSACFRIDIDNFELENKNEYLIN
jgi:hypothetical protein